MSIKRMTETELLTGLDADKAHGDELAEPLPHELDPLERLRGSVKRYDRPMDPAWEESVDPIEQRATVLTELTHEHGIAALRWFLDHGQDFGLSEQDLAHLVGAESESTFDAWLTGKEPVPASVTHRLGLLLGIYKGLVEITPEGNKQMAFEWFQRSTNFFPEFPQRSIRDYLLQNLSEEALKAVNRSVKGLAR